MHGYIYLTTNKINGKQYVGQHTKRNFDTKYKGSGKALLKAFKKYGFDNFECHIIDTAESQEELNDKEFVYIELYQTLETGYNLCEGGGSVSGYKHTEDSKRKLSEASKRMWEDPERRLRQIEVMTGEKHPLYGKHHTDEAKQKMSENHADFSGEKHPMYGRQHTEESKQKMSEVKKGAKNSRAKKCVYNDIEFGSKIDAYNYAKDYCGFDKSYKTFCKHYKG